VVTNLHVAGNTTAPDSPPTHLLLVSDGHGGHRCAQRVVRDLASRLSAHSAFSSDLDEALRGTFAEIDDAFLVEARKNRMQDGATAVAVVLRKAMLTCANVGDSRAILVRSDGTYAELSRDHKPIRPEEKKRILASGGTVGYFLNFFFLCQFHELELKFSQTRTF